MKYIKSYKIFETSSETDLILKDKKITLEEFIPIFFKIVNNIITTYLNDQDLTKICYLYILKDDHIVKLPSNYIISNDNHPDKTYLISSDKIKDAVTIEEKPVDNNINGYPIIGFSNWGYPGMEHKKGLIYGDCELFVGDNDKLSINRIKQNGDTFDIQAMLNYKSCSDLWYKMIFEDYVVTSTGECQHLIQSMSELKHSKPLRNYKSIYDPWSDIKMPRDKYDRGYDKPTQSFPDANYKKGMR